MVKWKYRELRKSSDPDSDSWSLRELTENGSIQIEGDEREKLGMDALEDRVTETLDDLATGNYEDMEVLAKSLLHDTHGDISMSVLQRIVTLGLEGWELAAVHEDYTALDDDSYSIIYIFKQPIE